MKKNVLLLVAHCWVATLLPAQVSVVSRLPHGPDSRVVLVAAHRADWRNAPENSLDAMRRAIRMGVDIIEVDVRRTKDGRFVIMHDPALDRTTTGKGLVADYTLAELRELRLLAATGHPTDEKIPTLEEALEVARGHAVINLDKAYDHPDEILAVVEACHSVDYSLFNIKQPRDEMRRRYPGFLDKTRYMIVAPLRNREDWALIDDYLLHEKPAVIQITFAQETAALLPEMAKIREQGVGLWVNSIWPELDAGHDDERAVTDPAGAYGWLLQSGVNIIQTDRPALLLEYLRNNQRHP